MLTNLNPFAFLRIKPTRKPATQLHSVVLKNALILGTEDGNNIVITPKVAREIAPLLSMLADKAEQERVSD